MNADLLAGLFLIAACPLWIAGSVARELSEWRIRNQRKETSDAPTA
jgi:hypothetical protein